MTCPQLPIQRKLVSDVLILSNRVLGQSSVRSQLDPDSFAERQYPRDVLTKPISPEKYQSKSALIKNDELLDDNAIDTSSYRQEEEDDKQFRNNYRRKKEPLVFGPIPVENNDSSSYNDSQYNLNDPPLEEMYDLDAIGQMRDIIRPSPLKRPDPADAPNLPLLRTRIIK